VVTVLEAPGQPPADSPVEVLEVPGVADRVVLGGVIRDVSGTYCERDVVAI
jgi:hypothetical protein